jgi:predicted GIY-YIG superfamily endonuclease
VKQKERSPYYPWRIPEEERIRRKIEAHRFYCLSLNRRQEALRALRAKSVYPDGIVIYGLVDPLVSELIYVGMTKDLASRLGGHNSCRKGALGVRVQAIRAKHRKLRFVVLEKNPPDPVSREGAWTFFFLEHGIHLLNKIVAVPPCPLAGYPV